MKTYRIFKIIGIFGALLSIYSALISNIAPIDFIILALTSLTLYSIGHEIKHKNRKAVAPLEIKFPIKVLENGVLIKGDGNIVN